MTAFSTMKLPAGGGPDGAEIRAALRSYCSQTLFCPMSSHAERLVLAHLDVDCDAHPEQRSLAEFVAFAVRDVIAHVDLSA